MVCWAQVWKFGIDFTNMFAGFGDNVRRYYEYFELADMLGRRLVLPPFSVNAADGTAACQGLDPAALHTQVDV